MSRRGKGCLLAIGAVIIVVVALFVLGPLLFWSKGEVTIVNDAHEPIGNGHFIVCKQQFELGKMQPHEIKRFAFKVNCEGDYDLSLEFASGRKLSRNIGYVNGSFEAHDTLSITDDDVVLMR